MNNKYGICQYSVIEFRIRWAFEFNLRGFSYSSITRYFSCYFLPPVWLSYGRDPKVATKLRFWYILRTQLCHLQFSFQILDMSSNAFQLHSQLVSDLHIWPKKVSSPWFRKWKYFWKILRWLIINIIIYYIAPRKVSISRDYVSLKWSIIYLYVYVLNFSTHLRLFNFLKIRLLQNITNSFLFSILVIMLEN